MIKRLLICIGLLFLALALLVGCSTNKYADQVSVSRSELLSGSALFNVEIKDEWLPDDDVLTVDEDMRAFLQEHVPRSASKERQLRLLMSAMLDQGLMNLKYDSHKTYTASDTYQQKTGNCLSYTNLFVALAREVGLKVSFQQVDVPPSWTRSGDYVMLNRHINVLVNNLSEANYVVDFNMSDFSGNYNTRKVDDNNAIAQYYSNIGLTHLEKGDHFGAFRYLKKALLIDPHQSAIWVNLGALYSRNGQYRHAEAAYFHALEENTRDHTANNNLAKLYTFQGKKEKAKYFSDRAKRHREANPYYYLWIARERFAENKFEESIENLKIALKKKEDEHLFYFWTGLSYYKLGDRVQAKHYFDKTLEHSYLPRTQERYKKQFEILLSRKATLQDRL